MINNDAEVVASANLFTEIELIDEQLESICGGMNHHEHRSHGERWDHDEHKEHNEHRDHDDRKWYSNARHGSRGRWHYWH
jgi:hypothetical protein